MPEQVILYTIGCPQCIELEKRLNKAGVSYEKFTDVDEMLKMGMKNSPMLLVGGKLLSNREAVNWLNNIGR